MVRLKDNFQNLMYIQAKTFQFLMVRLKVNSGNVSMLRAEISIPYGAIKSFYLR